MQMAHLSDLKWDFCVGTISASSTWDALCGDADRSGGGGGARVSNVGRFSVLGT